MAEITNEVREKYKVLKALAEAAYDATEPQRKALDEAVVTP
jgi:hypothetical protein